MGLLLKDAKIAKVPLTVITFMPAARMGDSTSYGGVITVEYPTVLIGG